MKIKRILAAIAASALALSAMTFSASALKDNQKAYMFGGAQVGWDKDVDGDDEADIIGGVNGSQWIGTVDVETGKATLKVSVAKGDLVEITCDAWGEVTDKPIFTATIDGTTYDCYFGQPVAYAVTEDISKLTIDIQWLVLEDGEPGAINDWCGSYIVVTAGGADAAAPGGEAAPAPGEGGEAAPAPTDAPATGNVPAAVMASVMAVAGVAVVASRKRK